MADPYLIDDPEETQTAYLPPGEELPEELGYPPEETPQTGVPFYPPEGGGVDPYAAWNTAATANPEINTQAIAGGDLLKLAFKAGGMPAVWKLMADMGATPQQLQQMQSAYTAGGAPAALAALAGMSLFGAGVVQNLLGMAPKTTTGTVNQTTTGTTANQQQATQNTQQTQQQQQNTNQQTNQQTNQNLNQQTGQTYNQQTGQTNQQQTNQNFNQAGSQQASQDYVQNAIQNLINQMQTNQQQTQQGQTTYPYAPAMADQYLAAQQGIQPGAMALYGQGTDMMQALLNGEIPAGLTTLAGSITDPIYADAVQKATEQARLHGFHDAPLSSPVGGAVLAPLLQHAAATQANLTNQMINNLIPQFMNPGFQATQLALGGMGAVPGLGQAYTQAGTQTGQQTGTQTGTTAQTGSQTGSQTSQLGGSQTGTQAGTQTGYQTGAQAGTNVVNQTGTQVGQQTGQQNVTGQQTGQQTGTQTQTGQTTGTVNQTGAVTQPQQSIAQTATQAAPLLTGAANAANMVAWQNLWNAVTGGTPAPTSPPPTSPPPGAGPQPGNEIPEAA